MSTKAGPVRFHDESVFDLFYLSRYVRVIRRSDQLILVNTLYGTSVRFSAEDGPVSVLIGSLRKGTDEETLIRLLNNCDSPEADFSILLRRCMLE